MANRQTLRLRDARDQTPAQALGDWALALREAAFDAITEQDITAIMKAQVDKAKAGDPKAAQFVLDYFTKVPTTVISMGIRDAAKARPTDGPTVVVQPRKKGRGREPDGPSDEDLDRQIEEEQAKHPLWKPSPYPPHDPRHNAIVDARVAAGLPARHPDDPDPDLN